MNWWNRRSLFGSTKYPVDVDAFGERPYAVYSSEDDVVAEPHEVYSLISPDNRFPREEFFEEYKVQVARWQEEIASALETARRQNTDRIKSWQNTDTLISILIDHSGSLQGDKQVVANLVASELDRALLQGSIPFEMLGFTTRNWQGGQSRKKWKLKGSPKAPGRLCDLLHIKYRVWEDRNEYENRYDLLLDPQVLKENVDGEAIAWARSRFELSPYTKHLIVIISDGAPVDDSTLMENHDSILFDHWKSTIEEYEQATGKCIIGFGIGYEVDDYITSACDANSVREVPATLETLIGLMSEQLDHWID